MPPGWAFRKSGIVTTAFAMSMLVPGAYLLLYVSVAVFFGGYDEILD